MAPVRMRNKAGRIGEFLLMRGISGQEKGGCICRVLAAGSSESFEKYKSLRSRKEISRAKGDMRKIVR